MGACFDITASRASGISVGSKMICGIEGCRADLVSADLSVEASAVKGLQIGAMRIHEPLDVECRLICSLPDLAVWLRVSPEEVQWITDDIGVFYDVVSNVEWIVEID